MAEVFTPDRIVSTERVVEVDPALNITDLLEQQVTLDAHNVLFSRRDAADDWDDITAEAFRADVVALAKGLIASGVASGDRVAILSATRYEWTLLDFACFYAGAVPVPIYESSSASQIAWILQDSGAIAAFAENASYAKTIAQAVSEHSVESLRDVYTIDGPGLDDLRAAGEEITDAECEARRSEADLQSLATIIYTSGTTGRPKGCELTHGNFVDHSLQTLAAMDGVISRDSSTVLFLPLAHVFARFVSIIFIAAGGRVAHTADIKQLIDDLAAVRPTFLLGVPRVFEKIYNAAALKAEAEGKGKIFAKAVDVAVKYSRATTDSRPSLLLKAQHALFSKLVYSKLITRMGGNVTHAFSGGSPLGERTSHFFNGIGVQIIEGYGLTETSAPITGNIPSVYRIGTVGTPLPGNDIALAEDGEILGRGVCVFRGYRENPQAMEESFVSAHDGGQDWFRTGDLGELDEVGRLKITGRKKEILVTAGGKNVSPAQLEDVIRADVLVSQAVVVGEGRPFVGALITLDSETIVPWCRRQGIDPETPLIELTEHPRVLKHLQSVIDQANSTVSQAESIREFTVLGEDFTIESGHLTPSLKIKRPEVMRDFSGVVDALYSKASAARERAAAAGQAAGEALRRRTSHRSSRRKPD
ncbi:AMP-dependent synthetase/ligase [Nesterenkonia flava]|uniref:AMP-dependent synthetase/ligase n=1 Tax=Nesterenkonia flava TaxID=469799 RepID=A0ABU1FXL9_9MICC|nr:AMP-dependent synthetase/ligase [Nesterenkonia flava]MDR5713002.1 AMP-dependent synthetase/ligase [Nesterenkonia flava]